MLMKQVVIYLDKDYKKNETIWVSGDSTKEDITEKINQEFGEEGWYSYDII